MGIGEAAHMVIELLLGITSMKKKVKKFSSEVYFLDKLFNRMYTV